MSVSRRALLRILGGTAAATVVGVPLLSGVRGSSSTGELLPSRRALPQPFTRALTIPPVLPPTRSDATGDYYDIVQKAAYAEILPGVRTQIWGYNGTFPGPTIISRSHRRAVITHHNELPVPVVVHLHGGHTPPEHDGYPTDLLYPLTMAGMTHDRMGGTIAHGQRDYIYPLQQRAATLWYHDHRMDFTGPSLWRGLAGFHLIGDDEEQRLPLPTGDRDIPLMITDRSFDTDGSLLYPSLDPTLLTTPGVKEPYGAGVLGDVILVNGTPWPVADVSAVRYRLRLLNASNARRYKLTLDPAPPGGPALVQIGTDGGLLTQPIAQEAIEIAPAQRFDIIVDFSRYQPGQEISLRNEFGDATTTQVMRFRVAGPAADTTRIPDQLSTAAVLPASAAAVTRTLRLRHDNIHGMPGWTINGQPFNPDRDFALPKLGTTEIWRLTTDFHHPIHLHLSHFQVLSRGIGAPGAYDHGWKDTIDLRPAEEATIIVPFDDYTGRFVFHCHNLEHEDMAMMGNFATT
jgi:spore coat protein A, manganese oxidase